MIRWTWTKDQIKDALVAQYGPRVLATPSGHGIPPAADVSFNGHLVAHASL